MKLSSVFVVSMVALGLSFASAPARATGLTGALCVSLDGSCSSVQNPTCTTNADCALSVPALVGGLTVCDTAANRCVSRCSSDFAGNALHSLSCGASTPACNGIAAGALAGLCSECTATNATRCATFAGARPVCLVDTGTCGCSADVDCSGGKTCNRLLHQCVAATSLPPITLPIGDGGVTLPLPTPDGGGLVPTIPSPTPGSPSTGGDPEAAPPEPGASTPVDGRGDPAAVNASASGNAGAGGGETSTAVDAKAAPVEDGGCSSGGHGSGVTWLGVLGAALALAGSRRRRGAR